MTPKEQYPINPDWMDYYDALEHIRKVGYVNMFGAAPSLTQLCDISHTLAQEVLVSWISNYEELAKMRGWRR